MDNPFSFNIADLSLADLKQVYNNLINPVPGGIVEKDPIRRDAGLNAIDEYVTWGRGDLI